MGLLSKEKSSFHISKVLLEIVLLVLMLFFSLTATRFFTMNNLLNVLRNVSMQGIIAFTMTLVIISGEIDLSVGSSVALSGCITAYITRFFNRSLPHVPHSLVIPLAILAALLVGFSLGIFTGIIRTRYRVPTFIATLALMTGLSGVANLLTRGFPITPFPEWYNFFGGGYIAGIPFPAIMFLSVFLLIFFLTNYTSFGRAIYAIGGNAEAARLSGINVSLVKTLVMGLTMAMSALSGVLVSSQIMSGTPTAARGWELDVISAVIIGGVSLQGGSGRIWRTFIGVIFIGVMINGMTLLNINEYWQYVVRGILILSAVLINQMHEMKKTH